jgi:hypothetical protein
MAGLIWFVQIVHYPSFAHVGTEQWPAFHQQHARRTTWVVLPVMLAEATTGVLLWWQQAPLPHAWLLGLLGLIWLSTFAVQVPIHNKLGSGLDPTLVGRLALIGRLALVRRLVLTNWVRTIAWSARAVVLLGLLVEK